MSQADELLNSLTENTLYNAAPLDGNIVIDSDRFIMVPESLKKIGVQYDHNITTATFDCPRYWDGRDLSTMRFYVNYMRPDGMAGSYLCDGVAIDSSNTDIIHFDWVISGNVTAVQGQISFLVCAKCTDSEGNEKNHWNSELNQDLYVSAGMRCQDVVIHRHPDVITQLLVRMEQAEDRTSYESIHAQIDECLASEPTTQETINGKVVEYLNEGSALQSAVDEYLTENPDKIPTDDTLSEAGTPADAAAVGTLKQNTITATGILKGDGNGGVSEAVAGTDFVIPESVYTKEETVSDETKALYGMVTDVTPDDVFKVVAPTSRVGTILSTMRTDLGENWMLCNGDKIARKDYPEIGRMSRFESAGGQQIDVFANADRVAGYLHGVAFHDGTWVAVGYRSDTTPIIRYTTDPAGKWTEAQVSEIGDGMLFDVTCCDGTWVAVGYDSSNFSFIYHTTDPAGVWTKKYLSTETVGRMTGIAGHGGKWVAVGRDMNSTANGYLYIYYTDSVDGEWVGVQVSTTHSIYDGCKTIYLSSTNQWLLVIPDTTTSSTVVCYATDPAGTWSGKTMGSSSAHGGQPIFGGVATDGNYIVIAGYGQTTPYPQIYYTTAVSSTWTQKSLTTSMNCYLKSIAYYNGLWVAVGYDGGNRPYVYYTDSPTGSWTGARLDPQNVGALTSVACDATGAWVAVGHATNSDGYQCIYHTTSPDTMWNEVLWHGETIYPRDVVGYDGLWVAAGYDADTRPCIYYTTEPAGAWTKKRLSNTAHVYLYGLACYEGMWVAVGYDPDGYPYIYYTDNPTGEWTGRRLATSVTLWLQRVACYEGTWVAVGYNSSARPTIRYTNDPSGVWTEVVLTTSQTSKYHEIAYYEGKWVVVISAGAASNIYALSTDDLTGTWTMVSLGYSGVPYGIVYYDGAWVVSSTQGTSDYSRIYYTTDPAGSWRMSQIQSDPHCSRQVIYHDGLWLAACSDGYIRYTTDPTTDLADWTLDLACGCTGDLYGLACCNGTWVAVGSDSKGRPQIVGNSWATLPMIAVDRGYAYIKVLEG